MRIKVERFALKKAYTVSRMLIDGEQFCDVLEDTVRKDGVKVWGETAIPEGVYKMRLSFSQRFQRILPEILNVPNFTGIRIHGGNTAEDSHGCLLVGINEVKGKVLKSQIMLAKLIVMLQNTGLSEFEIEITNQ